MRNLLASAAAESLPPRIATASTLNKSASSDKSPPGNRWSYSSTAWRVPPASPAAALARARSINATCALNVSTFLFGPSVAAIGVGAASTLVDNVGIVDDRASSSDGRVVAMAGALAASARATLPVAGKGRLGLHAPCSATTDPPTIAMGAMTFAASFIHLARADRPNPADSIAGGCTLGRIPIAIEAARTLSSVGISAIPAARSARSRSLPVLRRHSSSIFAPERPRNIGPELVSPAAQA